MAYPDKKNGVCFFTNSSNGLSIAKKLVQLTIGGAHPVFDDISLLKNYGDVDSPGMAFVKLLKEKGINAALKKYQIIKKTMDLKNIVNEGTMNTLGYYYLGKKDYNTSIKLFKINTEAFPKSANVFDSLGEAYMKAGNKKLAIKYYEKSVKLNPENSSGKKALIKLKRSK